MDQHGASFTVPGYTWTSSDEGVATVDAQGTASTTGAGTVTLTASATADGVTKQGQASLTVTGHVPSEREPTVHSAHITTDETWRASDNPHLVRGKLDVSGVDVPATLTLEPGVEVRFEADSLLYFKNGALKAPGTQARPIRLVAHQSAPTPGFWRGLLFAQSAGDSLMEYVTLSDCGSVDPELRVGTCLSLLSNTTLAARDLTIRNSGGLGVWLVGTSEFAAGSIRLSVSGSRGAPVRLHADQLGSLPTGGTFTGNGYNAIVVFGGVLRTQTWPNLGIPYDFLGPEVSITGNPSTPTTLTISAGTVLRFDSRVIFDVGARYPAAPVTLIVNGTEEAPVRFTSRSNTPRPGDWGGVNLGSITSNTRISHAIIEYAGDSSFGGAGGNLNLSASPYCTNCPTLEHVLLRKSSAHGMTLHSGSLASGSTGVTIRDNGRYAIAASANSVGNLPAGIILTVSGNSPDAVLVGGEVTRSQTWPNLGIPYDIFGRLSVTSRDFTSTLPPTTLTLSAGSVLRFGPQVSLEVGSQYGSDKADLIVDGTAEAPVRFTSASSTPRPGDWGGVNLGITITSNTRISHAIIEYAGKPSFSDNKGNLNVLGSLYCTDCPTLKHVLLHKSSAQGMTLTSGHLAPGSTGLTIRDNGSHAIRAVADSVGSIPAGTVISGNSPDAVDVYRGDVTTTQTWPQLGVPYVIAQSVQVGDSAAHPTLTLTPGTELRFHQEGDLFVQDGALVVTGTAQAPVRFVPHSDAPTKAFWKGVHVYANSAGTRIDHALISHAGAYGRGLRGNLNVYGDSGGFVTNSTFSDGGACGIMVSPYSGGTTDFTLPTYNNTFLNNTGAAQCSN
jgi:hypothetical protein